MKHFTETSWFEKLTDIVESREASLTSLEDEDCVVLQTYTPEGEDWVEEFYFDGTIQDLAKQVQLRVENFDVDEEAMLWIPHRGENGIPNSICALVDDAEWKLQSLKLFALTVMELTAEIKRGEVQ